MSTHVAQLLEQAKWTVEQAKKRGADGSRVTAERTTTSSVEWRDGKVDRVKESTSLSLAVTLFVDGRFSSNSTSDLRPAAIEAFLDDVVGMTKAIAKDPNRLLADPGRYADRYTGELKLFDAATADIAPEWRRRTASELEAAARAAPGADKIISVSTSVETEVVESAKATSNGMEGSESSTGVSLQAETSVRDADGKKPEGWWYVNRVRQAALPSVQEVGRLATERAMARIGAARRPTGKYACVIEAMTAGRLIGALTSALDGSNVQQRKSFLAGKIGRQIGSDLLTVIDDPHVVEGMGSRTYDGEGMATRKRPVFEKGVVKGYYLDTYYAKKLGMEATSGGSTNLSWPTGQRDIAGMLKAMGTGILVTGFNGGNSNTATGDFSFGIQGQWVENGKIVSPVTEMNLAGNHLEFWKRLVELGNDPFLSSSNRRPSLRFDKVQFSGT